MEYPHSLVRFQIIVGRTIYEREPIAGTEVAEGVKWLAHDGASLKPMKRPQAIGDLFALSEVQPELAAPARQKTSRPIHISGYHREANDFYATPGWVTEALLSYVQFRGRVWEPCCGTGAITTVLQRHGYGVTSTDIADHGFGTPGVDFLLCRVVPDDCRALVTNPPYGGNGASREGQEKSAIAMLRFVDHALRLTETVQGQLALLVRFQWVAGRRAAALISAAPFAAVIALTIVSNGLTSGRRPIYRSTIMLGSFLIMPIPPANLRRCCLLGVLSN